MATADQRSTLSSKTKMFVALLRRAPAKPLLWGILYLSLVPLFGLLYWQMPARSFYAGTIQREDALAIDAEALREPIAAVIKGGIESPSYNAPGFGSVDLDMESLKIGRIQLTDNRLIFQVTGAYSGVDSDQGADYWGTFSFDVEVLFMEGRSITFGRDSTTVSYVLRDTREVVADQGSQATPAPSFDKIFPSGSIALPEDLNTRLVHFYNAGQGDPKLASGYWWRMVYFSAVTVTTLGYGDITPITNSARMVVASEAVLGITFAGLFLNAVTSRERQSKKQSDRMLFDSDRVVTGDPSSSET